MAGILPVGGGSSALEQYAALLQSRSAAGSDGAESTGGADQLTAALAAATGASRPTSTGSTGFAGTLATSLENVQALQSRSADLAIQAATGDLDDIHDYTIAAAEARSATEVTVALRNKALEAFSEIMRMQF